jgi:integrase/recombinase XerD
MSDTIDTFEEYLRIVKGLGDNSVKAYMADIILLEKSARKDILSLTTEDILEYLSGFDKSSTINRKLSSINAFYRFCETNSIEMRKVSIEPAKTAGKLPLHLEHDYIIDAVSKIDRTTLLGRRDYALILFLYASGCRISEALSAERGDIKDGWLKIRFAKGEKERMVPLAPIALDALDEYMKYRDYGSTYLWTNYRGEKLSRIGAYKIVRKYLGVSPHTLRHSFASALIAGGADLRVVQELLGHSSLATTQIYTHIRRSRLSETVERHHPINRNGIRGDTWR